jgi:hypothetical protein
LLNHWKPCVSVLQFGMKHFIWWEHYSNIIILLIGIFFNKHKRLGHILSTPSFQMLNNWRLNWQTFVKFVKPMRLYYLNEQRSWWYLMHTQKIMTMFIVSRRSVTSSNNSNWVAGECFLSLHQKRGLGSILITKKKKFFLNSKCQAQFQSMEVRNQRFTAFIDVLTANTYIMVIMSDPTIRKSFFFLYYGIIKKKH